MGNRKVVKRLDAIGGLPDELLHKILSHLNAREVVQSSVLSKRWKTLWVYHRNVNIEDRMWSSLSLQQEQIELHTFIRGLFDLREAKIEKFRISCSSYTDDKDMDDWIHYYASYMAEEIIIENMSRLLPESLHSYDVIKTVRLSSVVLHPAYCGILHLKYGNCMENLIIKDCPHFGIEHLRVHAPGLKNLIVENNHSNIADARKTESCVFQLTGASNLMTVELKGYVYGDYLFEVDMPTLLSAHLDMKLTNIRIKEEGEGIRKCLPNVLKGLSNAKSLTISAESLHGGCWKWEQMQSIRNCMFFKLKLFEFQIIQGCDEELNFLRSLVKNAVCLENILVEVKNLSKVNETKLIEFGRNLQWLPKASSRITIQILSKGELDRETPRFCHKFSTGWNNRDAQ